MKVKSKALEVNLADYHVDVTIDAKYFILQEVMSKYYGLMEGLSAFLMELSHPYKNWRYIVTEARKYSLEYFHLLKKHPGGPEAARLLIDIFIQALKYSKDEDVRRDSVDNLLLLIQKIINDTGSNLINFQPIIDDTFNQIHRLPDTFFALFVKSFYGLNRLAKAFWAKNKDSDSHYGTINRLLIKYYEQTYLYWLNEEDPRTWFEKEAEIENRDNRFDEIFSSISHYQLKDWQRQLKLSTQVQQIETREGSAHLLALPGFGQIVDAYRRVPRQILQTFDEKDRGHHLKLIFLFHIMNLTGLSLVHEETLRDINQTLTWIIENENYRNIENLIRKTCTILKEQTRTYPATALNCVLNMGKALYKTDELDLVNFFIDAVIDLGFQSPMLKGVDNEWQIKVNSAHILNIRTWLELIEVNPKWSIRLLSGLIIHLSL